jgi:cytochrome c oxidase subunit IV
MTWHPPRLLVLVWLALLALLGLTVLLAYQPLGEFNYPVALTIAVTKALLIAIIFMELREQRGLIIAFAGAGVFWLGLLIWLAGTDYMTRADFPPNIQ